MLRMLSLIALKSLLALTMAGCIFELEPPLKQSEVVLVEQGASWRYLDNDTTPTGWEMASFDDSSWMEGPAPLGYGDDGLATIVAGGPDGAHFVTTYFRHRFVAPDPKSIARIRLRVLRDDGVVVSLNGSEVLRDNLPAGAVSSSTFASGGISSDAELVPVEATLGPSELLQGENVLAVAIHQDSVDSSDIRFALELSAAVVAVR